MSPFEYQITPMVFAVWIMTAPFFVILIDASAESARGLVRLLSYNAIVLALFCAFWYVGFYFTEYWMHVIDFGAPWSWFAVLASASFAVSFWQLRKHSKRIAKALVGPVITAPAFWLWLAFCAIKFDPFW